MRLLVLEDATTLPIGLHNFALRCICHIEH